MSEPPRDWFHYNAKQAEALDRLERRLTSLEDRLGESPAPTTASQEVAAQAVPTFWAVIVFLVFCGMVTTIIAVFIVWVFG
jgi:hypothetical protein